MNDAQAAKKFLKNIETGKAIGIVSTWTLLEIITVVRNLMARQKMMSLGDIEAQVERVIGNIYRIRNLKIMSGTPMEMSQIGRNAPMIWEVFEESLEHLRHTLYEVQWDSRKKIHTISGIGSSDALHVMLALFFGCDFIATFDRGFWIDERPISIFDVKANRER